MLDVVTTPKDGVLEIPTGWRQGAGAYGGLVVAAMMRAADQAIGDPTRTARSVTAEIPAPVEPGRAELAVEILRAGKSVTTARVALRQHGETRAHAVVVAAAGRGTAAWNTVAPYFAPRWDTLAPLPSAAPFPEFAQHFDYRIVEGFPGGPPSVSRGEGKTIKTYDAKTVGWIRAREPGTRRDAAYVAAMIDAWYPSALVLLRAFRPMATIAFTLEMCGDPRDVGDEPLLYRATSPVCDDGYSFETRELWSAEGRLLARNHQTFVIIK